MRPRKLRFGTPVRVVWEDSACGNGWDYRNPKSNIGRTTKIVSLGYVVNSKDAEPPCLTLTTSIDDSAGVLSPVTIPWRVVMEMEILDPKFGRQE